MSQSDKEQKLRDRLQVLEKELVDTYAALSRQSVPAPLPGLYMVVETPGFAALLPASLIKELVRLVECVPVPTAPKHVLGTFLYRGQAVMAVDLAARLNVFREPPLDAYMLILATSRPAALVVDRVRTLIESPLLAGGGSAPSEGRIPSALIAGVCCVGDEHMPILSVHALLGEIDGVLW